MGYIKKALMLKSVRAFLSSMQTVRVPQPRFLSSVLLLFPVISYLPSKYARSLSTTSPDSMPVSSRVTSAYRS